MKKIETYVKRMNSLSLNTVESILEIGNLMIDAKSELSTEEYQEFLKVTNYDQKSASVRKWEVIGKSYLRLKPIASLLPPIWSTIYKLSSLKPYQLDLLQQMNILHPSMTAKEIDDELKIPSTIYINNRRLINEILESEKILEKDRQQIISELDKLDQLPNEVVAKNLKSLLAQFPAFHLVCNVLMLTWQ
jgi:hypothetical protein